MSDDQLDQMDRADEDSDNVVEAHQLDQIEAKEEPPDVEGHAFEQFDQMD